MATNAKVKRNADKRMELAKSLKEARDNNMVEDHMKQLQAKEDHILRKAMRPNNLAIAMSMFHFKI